MKISAKLIGISGCSAVIVTAIVVSLLGVMQSESAGYTSILQGKVENAAAETSAGPQERGSAASFNPSTTTPSAPIAGLIAAQRAATLHQLLVLVVVFGIVLAIDSFFYCSVLVGVFKRLSKLKVVSDRLAKADIQGLTIDISGDDEIGEIGESLKGVAAAIEELLAVRAH